MDLILLKILKIDIKKMIIHFDLIYQKEKDI